MKPGSSKGNLVLETEDGLIVHVKERAVDGAANEALIALLAKHFGVRKMDVSIKSGHTSKRKIVNIDGGPKGT